MHIVDWRFALKWPIFGLQIAENTYFRLALYLEMAEFRFKK